MNGMSAAWMAAAAWAVVALYQAIRLDNVVMTISATVGVTIAVAMLATTWGDEE